MHAHATRCRGMRRKALLIFRWTTLTGGFCLLVMIVQYVYINFSDKSYDRKLQVDSRIRHLGLSFNFNNHETDHRMLGTNVSNGALTDRPRANMTKYSKEPQAVTQQMTLKVQEPQSSTMNIPRIFHQTWDDLNVPSQVLQWIPSWLSINPSWTYWFWTEKSSKNMIHELHPKYFPLYEDYPYRINKADVRRYFILYEYGGIYADLDVSCIKPMEDILDKYQCIIAQEPMVHQTFIYKNKDKFYLMPAFMACRPKHPYFKMVLESLATYKPLATKLAWNDNILRSTGPKFLSDVYQEYIKTNRTLEDTIYVAPADWFMPSFDILNADGFREQCKQTSRLRPKEVEVCKQLNISDFKNVRKDAYTDHHWLHTWSFNFNSVKNINIRDIESRAVIK